MNLTAAILQEHSKKQKDKIVRWIGDDQKRFDELIKLFLESKDPIIRQRAGWPLSYAAEAHPALVKKHMSKLAATFRKPGVHEAVTRNIARIFQCVGLPEKIHGPIMDASFQLVCDPKEKPASKAFALTVLERLAAIYPEIKPELKLAIEERWDTESAAFRSRAKKILKKL